MELPQIESNLQNSDYNYRIKAIAALRDYPSDIATPLLTKHILDQEFLVRTFVARELGHQQTSDAFAGLLELIMLDNTPNVRAEAANSLSLFGQISTPHLLQSFVKDDHWLVRTSILAALVEMDCPEVLLEVCLVAIAGEDIPVQEAAISALGSLAHSSQTDNALSQLLILKDSETTHLRARSASALQHFKSPAAKAALAELRADHDHTVIRAAMEPLLEE
ncbi:MAG: HEAT repeat domain-containing protein [Cyanobacteria bacterium]|nr:HEAT repeat domain-containing protein [Cyanobacteriota bacterium]